MKATSGPRATAAIVRSFLSARFGARGWTRAALIAHQERALARYLARDLPRAPFYAGFSGRIDDLRVVDKACMMSDFAAFNSCGVTVERAAAFAVAAERSRDFAKTIGNITVGLSSGTSGNRGLFLVSERERHAWAGIVLARVLTNAMAHRVWQLWRAPLRIAFFLRSDSALYRTVASRRIQFDYYDLERPFAELVATLAQRPPHLLVAPASILCLLARARTSGALPIRPDRIVAVAEVLDPEDAVAIGAAFSAEVHQVYQCTEGLLAYTCERGALHLNERYLRIDAEWLDTAQTRFVPIVTDFTRTTQIFARYRLDDVLRIAPACACGRPERTIAAIEGRADDVIRLAASHGDELVAVFPDFIRRAMALAGDAVRDYRVRQTGDELTIALETHANVVARERVRAELDTLWERLGVRPPTVRFVAWEPEAPGKKRRRIIGGARPRADAVV